MDATDDDIAMDVLADQELFVWRYRHIRTLWIRRVFHSLAWMLVISLAPIVSSILRDHDPLEDLPTAVWPTLIFICLDVLSAYHHPVSPRRRWLYPG